MGGILNMSHFAFFLLGAHQPSWDGHMWNNRSLHWTQHGFHPCIIHGMEEKVQCVNGIHAMFNTRAPLPHLLGCFIKLGRNQVIGVPLCHDQDLNRFRSVRLVPSSHVATVAFPVILNISHSFNCHRIHSECVPRIHRQLCIEPLFFFSCY